MGGMLCEIAMSSQNRKPHPRLPVIRAELDFRGSPRSFTSTWQRALHLHPDSIISYTYSAGHMVYDGVAGVFALVQSTLESC